MTKDELKDRISMALKDPILQQGFEIICRENDELEKENEIFKKANKIIAHQRDDRDADISILEERIEELEEENAELKKRNGELAGQKASLERWFGEAKGIIRNIIRVTWGEGWSYSLDWKVKAEKFLEEVEND
jgi:predicted nuclease with TOPRIM domain